MYRVFKDRQLHERSNLTFEFPGPNGKTKRAFIPFLENCDLSENQSSNLAEYSLLARSGSIYSYLGAKSRKFNLVFKITFNHVVDTLGIEGINQRFKQIYTINATDEDPRKSFFPNSSDSKSTSNHFDHAKTHRNFYEMSISRSLGGTEFINAQARAGRVVPRGSNPDDLVRSTPNMILDERSFNSDDIKNENKVINLILYWINLVRTSVINNSKNTVYGCPIVKITHGPMYNNIPCITENFSIKTIENAGIEVETLLPKQVEISMSLVEHRVGDFGEFKSMDVIRGDNNTGWESFIEENNMDPYNGIIMP